MTDYLCKLGRRVISCKGWRWMPGMAAVPYGCNVVASDFTYADFIRLPHWRFDDVLSGSWVPDLEDPATLGCVLDLVREAWWCDGMHTCRGGRCNKEWHVRYDGLRKKERPVAVAYSEAEALVAALEAAP